MTTMPSWKTSRYWKPVCWKLLLWKHRLTTDDSDIIMTDDPRGREANDGWKNAG